MAVFAAAAVAGLIGLIITLGAWYVGVKRRPSYDLHRVLAPAFVNRTGDAAFDPVAAAAVAGVSSGLSEIEGVEIVDGAETSMKAGTIARGAIYRQGDSVQGSATVAAPGTGRTLYTVGPVAAAATNSPKAVEEVVQRMIGGVAMLLEP